MLCSIDGKEIKDFQIDYGKVYHALAYDEDNCRTVSSEELTKAENEFSDMCRDFDVATEADLLTTYYDAVSFAEAMAFEMGIKFALNSLALNILNGKDNSNW